MAVDRRQANMQKLSEADAIQDKTQEAIERIKRQAAETEEVANLTLKELQKQGSQLDDVNADLESVSSKLDQSQQLQNKFDAWAGNWFGGKKRAALKEAASEIAARNTEEIGKVKEVFEHEKYDRFSRIWKSNGMVLCTNPTVEAPQIFDPALQANITDSNWNIDFSLSGIDAEGWTYASDYNYLNTKGAGESTPKWNSFVRRRKWRHHEKGGANCEGLQAVQDRHNERTSKAPAGSGVSATAEKIGYVPRARMNGLTATGLTSTSMVSKSRTADQELDNESAAGLARVKARDAVIDQGIDCISNTLDNLNRLAGGMKEEVVSQAAKVERVENNMQRAAEKQAIVNARQKKLVDSN